MFMFYILKLCVLTLIFCTKSSYQDLTYPSFMLYFMNHGYLDCFTMNYVMVYEFSIMFYDLFFFNMFYDFQDLWATYCSLS
jgi:hypothetical protein